MAAPLPQGQEGADGEGRRERQVAQRVFAAEFNQAAHHVKEEGTYGPSFVVSPYGAKVNRLFAVGVLTSIEAVGQAGDRYRAQIVDPTGTFNVYAGQYEPEATQQLMDIKPPAVVAIVGKSRAYSPEDGVTYVSVRPEQVRAVEKADRDAWVLETAKHSMLRLDAMREALKMDPPTQTKLVELGFTKEVAEGVIRAIEHYGKPELARQTSVVRDALESLLPGGASERVHAEPSFAPASSASSSPASAPAHAPAPAPRPAFVPPAKPAAPAASPHEPLVASLVEKLDDGKGAPWEDIVAEAAKKNVKETEVEECLNALMDKGVIYEPVLGRLKSTNK